jgi:uncharacterized protein
MKMRKSARVMAGCFVLALCACAALAVTFPALTGRIVDQAGIIAADKRASIEPKLASLDEKSGIQFVVATVKSLEGQEIEPYANELFRTWKLGEATKNNGVLLLVAPNERKVRIEVGYGLEGTLTDALAKIVIANAMAPRFKAGDFGGGIERGVDDVITILTTDAAEWQARPAVRPEDKSFDSWMPLLIFLVILFIFWMSIRDARRRAVPGAGRRGGGGPSVWFPSGGGGWSSGGSGGSGWSGGGGFSGGGGSSGGGGASGGW